LPETIYDIAIVGSGPAGYTAAIRAGQYGLKTALIEKDGFLGGTCLHVGCIPTKALLFNAEIWDHLKDAREFGIEGVDSRKLNWAAIQERKSKIVSKHAKGLEFLMRKNKVETIKGYGTLAGPAQNGVLTVEVSDGGKSNLIKTKNVILATGSEARMIPGLEPDTRVLTNIDFPLFRFGSHNSRNAAASRSGGGRRRLEGTCARIPEARHQLSYGSQGRES
jgi:dihydrolipoamide dehydrogenase